MSNYMEYDIICLVRLVVLSGFLINKLRSIASITRVTWKISLTQLPLHAYICMRVRIDGYSKYFLFPEPFGPNFVLHNFSLMFPEEWAQ
jgi:hypothetical protein